MAAGLVYHNITTATGVTFQVASWVPDTSAADVGGVPVHLLIKSDGTVLDPTLLAQGGGKTLSDIVTALGTNHTDMVNALTGTVLAAGENHIGSVGYTNAKITQSFTRPGDTTAYTTGDLVANSTTAGSVTPMSFAVSRATGKGGQIRRIRLRKSGTSTTNAQFRLHLYSVSPTCANGDNGAWSTNQALAYIGKFDVTVDEAFTDGASGNAAPYTGNEVNFVSDTVYGLLEARAAYTPITSEVFTVELEVWQN